MMSNYHYSFPAIKGIQASNEYYVAMCPLKLIPKIFLFDEEELPPEFRAQRVINKSRIPEIIRYILNNPKDYVFSSITASIDGEMQFIPYSEDESSIGKLLVSMDSRFLINDGQHRRSAIEEAMKQNPELGNETISVVFYADKGLKRCQQIFSDLNKHAVNTTKSISILYDSRDPIALLTKEIVDKIKLFKIYTDKENSSLSKYSPKIFTLSNLYSANCRLLNKRKGYEITAKEKEFVIKYWNKICNTIIEWNYVKDKSLSPYQLRQNYVHAYGVVLEALGMLGNYFYKHDIINFDNYIDKLNDINWQRNNLDDWQGRAINSRGKISKNNDSIKLTLNLIKQKIGIKLSNSELELERSISS